MKLTALVGIQAALPCILLASQASGSFVVQFQNGVDGYRAAKDTMLFAGKPDADFSTASLIWVDYASLQSHVLMQFDGIVGNRLDRIPPRALIVEATLTLRASDDGSPGLTVYPMDEFWLPTDTWNYWNGGVQAGDGEAQGTPCAGLLGSHGPGEVQIDVTNCVQGLSDGTANDGWAMIPAGPSANALQFYSCDHPTVAWRPRLTVVYEMPCPSDDNGDGWVDVTDLLELLSSWGDCNQPWPAAALRRAIGRTHQSWN